MKAYNLEPVNGEAKAELTKDITWTYSDGAKIETNAITKIGEETTIKITDAKGGNVTTVNGLKITTDNAGIVSVGGAGAATAITGTLKNVNDVKLVAVSSGTANVTVKAVLTDGTTLTQIFTYTIGEVSVANKGYTLFGATNATLKDVANVMANAPANTVEMALTTATTTLRWDNSGAKPTAKVALYLTKNGDPEDEKVDFTNAKIESLDPVVATAAVAGTEIVVTAQQNTNAKAQFRVTMPNATKDVYTFEINVQKAPELSDIVVDTPSVELSDEAAVNLGTGDPNGVEGVDVKTVKVTFKDQYGNDFALPNDFAGKLVISSNSVAGVTIKAKTPGASADVVENLSEGNIVYATAALKTGALTNVEYTIEAQQDKTASATVSAKLFTKADDATPKFTKTTAVTVVDIDGTATTSEVKGLGGLAASYDIDANDDKITDDKVDFSTLTYYLLDAKGHKLAKVDNGDTPAIVYVEEDTTFKQYCWIELDAHKTVQFDQLLSAANLASVSGSEKVVVKVKNDGTNEYNPGDTDFVSKVVTINYKNSKSIPHKATVNTTNVKISNISVADAKAGGITFEDLIFGKIDATQMLADNGTATKVWNQAQDNRYMAAMNVAKNAGYLYNKSVLNITDMNGKAIPTGTAIYGLASTVKNGNVWATAKADGTATAQGTFVIDDFTIADVDGSAAATVNKDTTDITEDVFDAALATGQTVTFKLVIRKVYVKTDDGSHKDENLLDAPVTVSFTISR